MGGLVAVITLKNWVWFRFHGGSIFGLSR